MEWYEKEYGYGDGMYGDGYGYGYGKYGETKVV